MSLSAQTEVPDPVTEIRRLLDETFRTPRLRDYQEAADYLGISVTELKRMVSDRAIGWIRIGSRGVRFSQADLDAWIARRRVPPARGIR